MRGWSTAGGSKQPAQSFPSRDLGRSASSATMGELWKLPSGWILVRLLDEGVRARGRRPASAERGEDVTEVEWGVAHSLQQVDTCRSSLGLPKSFLVAEICPC